MPSWSRDLGYPENFYEKREMIDSDAVQRGVHDDGFAGEDEVPGCHENVERHRIFGPS